MGVIFMDETRLERGLAATLPADVADYDDGTPTLVRRGSGLVQSGWPPQSASLTSWRHG